MSTSRLDNQEGVLGVDLALQAVVAGISAGAGHRDRYPSFPERPFRQLALSGVLAIPVPDPAGEQGRRTSFTEEWRMLRAVARGELRVGVWGADPIPGEGDPARLVSGRGGASLTGVETFCSGSTGLDRALVLARGDAPGPPLLAYVDLSSGVEIDTGWFKGAGMRASESHRVVFDGTPVLAVLGEPGELVIEPYFSRDAVRTAVTWAGIADAAVEAALDVLAAKSGTKDPDDVVSLAAGQMLTAQGTIERWLAHAASLADEAPASLPVIATQLRQAVARSCRDILDEAARAVGSHPFAVSGPLDRARRDLELFLLQHRLEPALLRRGRQAIEERRS